MPTAHQTLTNIFNGGETEQQRKLMKNLEQGPKEQFRHLDALVAQINASGSTFTAVIKGTPKKLDVIHKPSKVSFTADIDFDCNFSGDNGKCGVLLTNGFHHILGKGESSRDGGFDLSKAEDRTAFLEGIAKHLKMCVEVDTMMKPRKPRPKA